MSTKTKNETLPIYLSEPAVALLRKLDYPCSESVLASATPTDEGVELRGSRVDLEFLAGFVAGDANHADRRARRKLELLEEISEELESALASPSGRAFR